MSASAPLSFACWIPAESSLLLVEGIVMLVRSAVKKSNLFNVSFPLLYPPSSTRSRQMKDARVRSIGVRMHAARPALPIVAVDGNVVAMLRENKRMCM